MCPCALGDKADVFTEFATYVTDFVFYHGISIFCYKYQTLNVAVTVLMNLTLPNPQCYKHAIWVALVL